MKHRWSNVLITLLLSLAVVSTLLAVPPKSVYADTEPQFETMSDIYDFLTGERETEEEIPPAAPDTSAEPEEVSAPEFESGPWEAVYDEELSAPANLNVNVTSNGILVSWSFVETATGYRIYRKVNGSRFKYIATTGPDMDSWTDTSIQSGDTYVYTVSALRHDEVGPHDENGLSVCYLAAPGDLQLVNGADGLKLSWSAVEGIDSYKIYRSGDGSRKLVYTAAPGTTEWTDTSLASGDTVSYIVTGCLKDASSSTDEPGISGTRLHTPALTSAVNVVGGVKLTWTKVSGADNYQVYRRKGNNKPILVNTLDAGSGSWTDTSVTGGSTYSYQIVAGKGTACSTENSSELTVTYLSVPKIKSIAGTDSGLMIKWKAVKNAENYIIYRKVKGGSQWLNLTTVPASQTSWEDTSTVSGTTYYYTIVSRNADSQSALSDTGTAGIRLEAPEMTSYENLNHQLRINWEAVPGAAGYDVYIRNAKGAWKKVGSTENAYWHASDAVDGKPYCYTVRAYSTEGDASCFSTYGSSTMTGLRLAGNEITCIENTSGTAALEWGKTDACTGYEVQYSTQRTFTDTSSVSFSHATTLRGTVSGLIRGRTYYFRIRGYKTADGVKYSAAWSPAVSLTLK